MLKNINARWSSIGMLVGALMAAPCFIGILLIPIGLGAVMMSGAAMFLDEYRYIFMFVSLALLALSQYGLRKADVFRPTKLVWILTIIAIGLIAGELIVDPPWLRHALVPM